jgi:chaperone modulatory protein CbpM
MIWTIQQVVAELEVSEREVGWWIEQNWVLPVEEEGEVLFDEVDRARIQLIVELRRDLEVNDEAIPVVLRLLDQVYGLRRTLDELRQGIMSLSEDARDELEATLEQIRKKS